MFFAFCRKTIAFETLFQKQDEGPASPNLQTFRNCFSLSAEKLLHFIPKADLLRKKLIIADWPKYLRDSFTQRGQSTNGRWLALLARGSEMKALHLHNLTPCINVVCFLKKNHYVLKLLNRNRLSAKKNLIVAD